METQVCAVCGVEKEMTEFPFLLYQDVLRARRCMECDPRYTTPKQGASGLGDTKRCRKCDERKPLAEFTFDSSVGLYKAQCKACRAAARKENYVSTKKGKQYMPAGKKGHSRNYRYVVDPRYVDHPEGEPLDTENQD